MIQLVRAKKRQKKKRNMKTPALGWANPQRKAVCIKIVIQTPRKPNSAKRKVAKIRIDKKKIVSAYVPGMGHNLREYSVVLMRGGGVKDLPGIKYHLMRGLYDFAPWSERKTARSKYGVKKMV